MVRFLKIGWRSLMQVCKICGAEIKHIATGIGTSIVCDAEKKSFVTENGRMLFGYLIHKCENKLEAENGKNEKN